jgi:hypothetical protein
VLKACAGDVVDSPHSALDSCGVFITTRHRKASTFTGVDGTIDSCDPSKLVGQRACLLLVYLAIFVLMRRSSSRVFALVLAAGVVLSACSSTDRSAAPAEDVVATDQVTDSVEELDLELELAEEADDELASGPGVDPEDADEAQPELDGPPEGELAQVIVRAVRVCVINNRTTRDGRPAWLNVEFTQVDRVSREGTLVAPGDKICGWKRYEVSLDSRVGTLMAYIATMYDDTPIASVLGKNRALGKTELRFNLADRDGPEYEYMGCYISSDREMDVLDDGINRFTLERLSDSASFKEYTITVSDGESLKRCRRYPY